MWGKIQKKISFIIFVFISIVGYGQGVKDIRLELFKDGGGNESSDLYTIACPRHDYNNHNFGIKFSWEGVKASSMNKIIVELSSATGDFSTPVVLREFLWDGVSSISIPNVKKVGGRDLKVGFVFPTNVGGKYKIRVRSTSPVSQVESQLFSLGYLPNNVTAPRVKTTRFQLCKGKSVEIKVLDPNFPRYRWFKDGVLIPNESGSVIEVSQAGEYKVALDIGECNEHTTINVESFPILVESIDLQDIKIEGSNNLSICKGKSYTFSTNIKDLNAYYTWFKNGQEIIGASGVGKFEYTTLTDETIEGEYHVEFGANPECRATSQKVKIALRESFSYTISASGGNILLPGKTKTIGIITTAVNPTYKWYKGGVEIPNSNSAQLVVDSPGEYHAQITQGGDCPTIKQTTKVIIEYPAKFGLTINYQNSGYKPCTFNQATLEVTKILAETSVGERIEIPKSDYGAFVFSWKKENVDITNENSSTINLVSIIHNGTYKVNATLSGFHGVIEQSNELKVDLKDTDFVTIQQGAEVTVCPNTPIVLKAKLKNNVGAVTYQWKKEGVVIAGATADTYQVSGANVIGLYTVEVTPTVGCPSESLPTRVKVDNFEAKLINNTTEIYYPGRNKKIILEVTVTPDNAEFETQWYKDRRPITGATNSSYEVTGEGKYYAVVTQKGGCGVKVTTEDKDITIPTHYNAIIDYKDANTAPCAREEIVLELKKLTAFLSSGESVTVPTTDYQYYNFQWQKNSEQITAEKTSFVKIKLSEANGSHYRLKIGANRYSNELLIKEIILPKKEELQLTTSSRTQLLIPNKELKLEILRAENVLPLQDSEYEFKWSKKDSSLKGEIDKQTYTNSNIGAFGSSTYNEALGVYHLEIISKENALCKLELEIEIKPWDAHIEIKAEGITQKVINNEVRLKIFENSQIEVIGTFDFYEVSPSVQVDKEDKNKFDVNKEGAYTIKFYAGNNVIKELVREVILFVELIKANEIPNLVIPNSNTVANQKWILPREYMNNPKCKITIYSQNGQKVFEKTNYQGEWPDFKPNLENKGRAVIYFYIIDNDGDKKQGSVTVLTQ